MNRKGFILIELLIVVIIIGILATIALPRYAKTIEKARSAEAIINVYALRNWMESYWYDQKAIAASYNTATLDDIGADNPNHVTNRFFNYTLIDDSTQATKTYAIKAERIGKTTTHWVQWTQTDNYTGRLYRSIALGGPES